MLVEKFGKITVYYNVFSFTARVRAKTVRITEGAFVATKVGMQLDQFLRGKAEHWYANELSNTTRAVLRASIKKWCDELKFRFLMSPGVALKKLLKI